MTLPDKQGMDLNQPLRDAIRPVIEEFLRTVKPNQWVSIKLLLNNETTNAAEELCTRIIQSTAKIFFAEFREALSSTDQWMTEDTVHQHLGTVIADTFADVMGVSEDLRCHSTDKMTQIVSKEVSDRVNSVLSMRTGLSKEGAEVPASTSFSSRLRTMRMHVQTFLLRCAPKMRRKKSSRPVPEKSDADKVSLSSTVKFVQAILMEQVTGICSIKQESSSDEDSTLLDDSISQDTEQMAVEIVREIYKEIGLNFDGTSQQQEPDESSQTSSQSSCWEGLARKVKALFVCGFVKQAVLKLVKKLSCSEQTAKTPSPELLDQVGNWINEITTAEEEETENQACLYESVARKISSAQRKNVHIQFSELLFTNLKSEQKQRLYHEGVIKPEVDNFMKLMWEWLHQQMQLRDRNTDPVRVALKDIRQVLVEQTALPIPQLEEAPVISSDVSDEAKVEDQEGPQQQEPEPQSGYEWDKVACKQLALTLVVHVLKKSTIDTRGCDTYKLGHTLGEMLWAEIEGSVFPIKPKARHIDTITKAVYKDLQKDMGSKWLVQVQLLAGHADDYTCIVQTMKKYLVTPKRTARGVIKSFFKSVGDYLYNELCNCETCYPCYVPIA
ncbi:uncharacterized protein V6R79_022551 [Siganus canaliculatus]